MRGWRDAKWRASYDRMEIFLGLLTAGWWLIILAPGDSFRRAQSFDLLASIAREDVWALSMAIFVPLPLFAFLVRSITLRVAGLLFKTFWWTFLAALAFFANRVAPVIPIYLCVAAFAAHTIYRAMAWRGRWTA